MEDGSPLRLEGGFSNKQCVLKAGPSNPYANVSEKPHNDLMLMCYNPLLILL